MPYSPRSTLSTSPVLISTTITVTIYITTAARTICITRSILLMIQVHTVGFIIIIILLIPIILILILLLLLILIINNIFAMILLMATWTSTPMMMVKPQATVQGPGPPSNG